MTSIWSWTCVKCGHKQDAITKQKEIKCDECGYETTINWQTYTVSGG